MKIKDEAVEAALNAKPHHSTVRFFLNPNHYLEEEDVCELMRAALEAALPHLSQGAVRVKALEWSVERRSGFNIHVGRGLGLKYEAAIKAYNPGWIVTLGESDVVFDSADADEDSAKAAAQADYERRIMSALSPAPVGVMPTHRHKKRGTEYVLLGIGKMQAEYWEEREYTATDEPVAGVSVDMHEVVIYRSVDDGSLWVRPREEFEDGRFEGVDHD
ncbi:hypothetical protein [Pelagibacterium sediminicola]|uniref:hypothetical protein n=1 Tax=Pelagibacterium sediminicola TaxID=2248761 RepID=UPI0018E4DD97|nr:hypothetical protein [Pelagibacterium sediminicola]